MAFARLDRPCGVSVVVLALLALLGPEARAQTATAQITGAVTDQTGASLPGANVTVRHVDTGITRATSSNEAGSYTVPLLPPGNYEVTVQMSGFRPINRRGITLSVNQVARVDFAMEIGDVTESVNVVSGAPLIETDTATIGKVIEEKQIVDLPLVSRNFTELMALSPGTVHDTGGSLGTEQGSARTRLSGGGIFVGGSRAASNLYMIDGLENNDPAFQTVGITPPIDAIREFRLMTKNYGAEFGGSAAQVNIAIKSGTNDLHGTVYEFLRNDALNARNFFDEVDPITGRSKPPLRRNQFGFSLGGPLVIPKLVDGRGKLFFFANYEGTRLRQSVTGTGRWPTADQLQGDFSGDLLVLDPLTGAPFPDNRIPEQRISANAKQIINLGLFPTPNVPAQPGFNTVEILSLQEDVDQLHARVDASVSERDNVFIRTSISQQEILSPAIQRLGGIFDQQKGRNVAISYTRIVSPKLVNEFRLGLNRPIAFRTQEGAFDEDIAGQIFEGVGRDSDSFGAPRVSFSDFSSIGSETLPPKNFLTNSWSVVDGVTYTANRHTLKAGVEFRTFLFKATSASNPRGSANFTGLFTSGPLNPDGNAVADFLLGLPFQAEVSQGNNTGWFHGQVINSYVQDDWTLLPRLTVNLGLRHEYRTPLEEEGDRVSIFDPTFPGGRLLTPNEEIVREVNSPLLAGGASRGLVEPDRNNFAPRIGIVFRPFANNRSAIRAGYGIFYDNFEFNEFLFSVLNAPWRTTVSLQGTRDTPIDFDTLFPTAPTRAPIPGVTRVLSLDRTNRTPYTQQWNLNIQQQLGRSWMAEIGYVGSKSTKLPSRSAISQGRLLEPGPDPVIEFPFKNFGLVLVDRTEGSSNYHALISRIEKRFGNGTSFLAHYTFSKALGLDSAPCSVGNDGCLGRQNVWNQRADYGPLSFDVTHRLVVSGIVELPFGPGRRFGGGLSGVAGALIGGWQINGIYQVQSGFPFSVMADDVSGTQSSFFPRADLVGDPGASDLQDPSRAFNRFAFAQPQPGTFGSSGRNILRGEGLNNLDVSLFKNTTVGNGVNVQFRAEIFNALNHTQFGPFPGFTFSLDPASPFGVYRSTQHDARVIQCGLKIIF